MPGLIITVAQQKGGSGKTTMSAHLATALAYSGMSVAILDCDPQGSLGEWFEAREQALGEDETGLTFRTASGWGARREARSLAGSHDAVVIDTPPKPIPKRARPLKRQRWSSCPFSLRRWMSGPAAPPSRSQAKSGPCPAGAQPCSAKSRHHRRNGRGAG